MYELTIKAAELPQFNNKKLNSATKKIAAIGAKIAKNMYDVAFIMAEVEAQEAYKDDGFKSTTQWAMKTFGFKKTAAYSLLKIGKEYTAENRESNLPHEDGNDFTTTQIEKVLPLKDHNKVVELVEAEVITPDMSCKEIEKTVHDILNPGNGEGDGETEETAEDVKEAAFDMDKATADMNMYCEHIKAIFEEAKSTGADTKVFSQMVLKMVEDINSILKA